MLAEWLEVYTYIPAADRSVSFDMMAYLTKGVAKTEESVRARKIFRAWLLADLVETALTEKQQTLTLRYLNRKEG